jgi:hypothetical protein
MFIGAKIQGKHAIRQGNKALQSRQRYKQDCDSNKTLILSVFDDR